MQLRNVLRASVHNFGLAAAILSTVLNPIAPSSANAEGNSPTPRKTASPIQHVIIILGENRSFDHVFATYVPKHGETVSNLLSKGIVNADGTPGPNYWMSKQFTASDTTKFTISPGSKAAYTNIPPVMAGGPKTPFFTLSQAQAIEPGALTLNG